MKEEGFMQKITVKVDGMQCGMCEAHVNDAVRAAFPVKKVTSSHSKKETVIITDTDIPEGKIKEVIKNSGYDALEVTKEPYEKKERCLPEFRQGGKNDRNFKSNIIWYCGRYYRMASNQQHRTYAFSG